MAEIIERRREEKSDSDDDCQYFFPTRRGKKCSPGTPIPQHLPSTPPRPNRGFDMLALAMDEAGLGGLEMPMLTSTPRAAPAHLGAALEGLNRSLEAPSTPRAAPAHQAAALEDLNRSLGATHVTPRKVASKRDQTWHPSPQCPAFVGRNFDDRERTFLLESFPFKDVDGNLELQFSKELFDAKKNSLPALQALINKFEREEGYDEPRFRRKVYASLNSKLRQLQPKDGAKPRTSFSDMEENILATLVLPAVLDGRLKHTYRGKPSPPVNVYGRVRKPVPHLPSRCWGSTPRETPCWPIGASSSPPVSLTERVPQAQSVCAEERLTPTPT